MSGAALDRRSSLRAGPSVYFFSGTTRLTKAWSITPFEPLTTRAPEFVSPGSFRPQLAAEEVADQRRHLVELVFEREVAGIEEMEFSLWQVA